MAACALHNFLIDHVPHAYAPPKCTYQEDIQNGEIITTGYDTSHSHMEGLERRNHGNTLNRAKQVREEFKEYFVNEGKVPWQDKFIVRNRRT